MGNHTVLVCKWIWPCLVRNMTRCGKMIYSYAHNQNTYLDCNYKKNVILKKLKGLESILP